MILLLSLIKHVLDIVAPLADEEPSVYSEDKLQPPQCCEACKQCEQCVFPFVFLVFLLLFLVKSVKAAELCESGSSLQWVIDAQVSRRWLRRGRRKPRNRQTLRQLLTSVVLLWFEWTSDVMKQREERLQRLCSQTNALFHQQTRGSFESPQETTTPLRDTLYLIMTSSDFYCWTNQIENKVRSTSPLWTGFSEAPGNWDWTVTKLDQPKRC